MGSTPKTARAPRAKILGYIFSKRGGWRSYKDAAQLKRALSALKASAARYGLIVWESQEQGRAPRYSAIAENEAQRRAKIKAARMVRLAKDKAAKAPPAPPPSKADREIKRGSYRVEIFDLPSGMTRREKSDLGAFVRQTIDEAARRGFTAPGLDFDTRIVIEISLQIDGKAPVNESVSDLWSKDPADEAPGMGGWSKTLADRLARMTPAAARAAAGQGTRIDPRFWSEYEDVGGVDPYVTQALTKAVPAASRGWAPPADSAAVALPPLPAGIFGTGTIALLRPRIERVAKI